jgi:hypothetical protein
MFPFSVPAEIKVGDLYSSLFFITDDLRLIMLNPRCVFNLPECSPLSTKGASGLHVEGDKQ